jgi:hypothetical protein
MGGRERARGIACRLTVAMTLRKPLAIIAALLLAAAVIGILASAPLSLFYG